MSMLRQPRAKSFHPGFVAAPTFFLALLLSSTIAPAAVNYTIAFDDPHGTYSAYYTAIQRTLLAAGEEWTRHFNATAVIHLQVKFDTEPTMSADSLNFDNGFVGIIQGQNVFRKRVAAKLVGALDPNDPGFDAEVCIGVTPSTVAAHGYLQDVLWFDPDPYVRTAAIPADRIDAYSDFLHELGHAIAFSGYLDIATGRPYGNGISMYDRYVAVRTDGAGAQAVTNFYFTGPAARALYGGDVPLTFGGAEAVYHFGNEAPRPGSNLISREHELMNGVNNTWATRSNISALDLAVCADVGLPVLPADGPPAAIAVKPVNTGPVGVHYTVVFDDPQRVYAAYYDGIQRNLIAAGEKWGRHFKANAAIHLQVKFTDEASVTAISLPFDKAFVEKFHGKDVFRLRVAAKLVGTLDANDPAIDAEVHIGVTPSTFAAHGYLQDWMWFDPDPSARTAPIATKHNDAYTDFLRCLGDTLAFEGYLDPKTGAPNPGGVSMFDRYVVRRVEGTGAQAVTNFYFIGPAARTVYGGDVPLTAGDLHHFGNAAPGPGSDLTTAERGEVMNGVTNFYENRRTLSRLDLAVCEDVGLPVVRRSHVPSTLHAPDAPAFHPKQETK